MKLIENGFAPGWSNARTLRGTRKGGARMADTITSSQAETNEAHKKQAQKHKEVFEQKLKAATKEKGLIIG